MSDKRQIRGRFAQLMRALYTGRIGTLEFEERAEALLGEDRAVDQIYRLGAWCTYTDDRDEHFAGDKALNREARKEIARWILFLESDSSYDWPEYPGLPPWFFGIAFVLPIPIALWIERWDVLALGVILTLFITAWIDSLYQRMMLPGFKRAGDFAFWPFLSKSNYVAALAKPPYLCGFDRRS